MFLRRLNHRDILCVCVQSLSCIQLYGTPWMVAHQTPLSLGFTPGENTRVGCHFLLQGIFQTQRSNPCFPMQEHWQVDSLPLSHWGSHRGILGFTNSMPCLSPKWRCNIPKTRPFPLLVHSAWDTRIPP